ncbi:hypothetical protein VPHD479_0070 [Vibrio phage D479]
MKSFNEHLWESVAVERAVAEFIAATDDQSRVKIVKSVSPSNYNDFTWELFMNGYDTDDAPSAVKKAIADLESVWRTGLKREAARLVGGAIWYRGTRGDYGMRSRDGYATFLTENIHQAATYAGPDGTITGVKLRPEFVKEFNKPSDRFNQFTQFDADAKELGSKSAILVHGVVDTGPFRDDITDQRAATTPSRNVAVRNPDRSIFRIEGTISAAPYFEVLDDDWPF